MDSTWKTLSSRTVYNSDWIHLREDEVIQPNGQKSMFGVIEGKAYVMMIPKVGSDFYLIEQYRYPTKQPSIEFPAGGTKTGEKIEETIERELEEETGLIPHKVKKIGQLYVACSFSNVMFHVYVVEDFTPAPSSYEAEEGKIKLMKVSKEQIEEMIHEGRITDSQTLAAFQLYLQQ